MQQQQQQQSANPLVVSIQQASEWQRKGERRSPSTPGRPLPHSSAEEVATSSALAPFDSPTRSSGMTPLEELLRPHQSHLAVAHAVREAGGEAKQKQKEEHQKEERRAGNKCGAVSSPPADDTFLKELEEEHRLSAHHHHGHDHGHSFEQPLSLPPPVWGEQYRSFSLPEVPHHRSARSSESAGSQRQGTALAGVGRERSNSLPADMLLESLARLQEGLRSASLHTDEAVRPEHPLPSADAKPLLPLPLVAPDTLPPTSPAVVHLWHSTSFDSMREEGTQEKQKGETPSRSSAALPALQPASSAAPSATPAALAHSSSPPSSPLLSLFLHGTRLGTELMLNRLRDGGLFLKYGSYGRPHYRRVRCSPNLDRVEWSEAHTDRSTKGFILVEAITTISTGHATRLLQERGGKTSEAACCFSLITSKRTLDLEAINHEEREGWVEAFRFLLEWKRKQRGEMTQKSLSSSRLTYPHLPPLGVAHASSSTPAVMDGLHLPASLPLRHHSVSFVSALNALCEQAQLRQTGTVAPAPPSHNGTASLLNDPQSLQPSSTDHDPTSCLVEQSLEAIVQDRWPEIGEEMERLRGKPESGPATVASAPVTVPEQEDVARLPSAPKHPLTAPFASDATARLPLPGSSSMDSIAKYAAAAAAAAEGTQGNPPLIRSISDQTYASLNAKQVPADTFAWLQVEEKEETAPSNEPSVAPAKPAASQPMQRSMQEASLVDLKSFPSSPPAPSLFPVAPAASLVADPSVLDSPTFIDPSLFHQQDIFDLSTFTHLAAESAAEYGLILPPVPPAPTAEGSAAPSTSFPHLVQRAHEDEVSRVIASDPALSMLQLQIQLFRKDHAMLQGTLQEKKDKLQAQLEELERQNQVLLEMKERGKRGEGEGAAFSPPPQAAAADNSLSGGSSASCSSSLLSSSAPPPVLSHVAPPLPPSQRAVELERDE